MRESEKRRKAEERQKKRNTRSISIEESLLGLSERSSIGASSNEQENWSSVCLGKYYDHFVHGVLQTKWLHCTSCWIWMHSDCIFTEVNAYDCVMCNTVFQ